MDLHRELEFVLSTLINLNKKGNKEILTSSEIEEQLENLRDFNRTENALHKLALDIANADDEEKISDLLLELHFQFDSYMWQIDEIHELVKKLAGNCGSPN